MTTPKQRNTKAPRASQDSMAGPAHLYSDNIRNLTAQDNIAFQAYKTWVLRPPEPSPRVKKLIDLLRLLAHKARGELANAATGEKGGEVKVGNTGNRRRAGRKAPRRTRRPARPTSPNCHKAKR